MSRFKTYYDDFPRELIGAQFGEMLLYALFLFFVLNLLVILVGRSNESTGKLYLVVGSIFLAKASLIFLNEYYGIFDRKPAGNFVLWIYHLKTIQPDFVLGSSGTRMFYLQYLINYPALKLLGPSREIVILTNAFLTTLGPLIAYEGLLRIYGKKVAVTASMTLLLYPGSVNWSIFGLRDAIIYVFIIIGILAFLFVYWKRYMTAMPLFLVSVFGVIFTRPELLSFFVLPFGWIFIMRWRDFYLTQKKSEKYLLLVIFYIGFLIPGLILIMFLYNFVIGQIGAQPFTSPFEIAGRFAIRRFERHENGSDILPPHIYANVPLIVRWVLQSVGILLLPFPWLINSIAKVLAFLDSLFILYVFSKCLIYLRQSSKNIEWTGMNKEAKYLVWTFIVAIAILGLIVSNGGNAFRMRLVIFPYLAISYGILSGWAAHRRKVRSELSR